MKNPTTEQAQTQLTQLTPAPTNAPNLRHALGFLKQLIVLRL